MNSTLKGLGLIAIVALALGAVTAAPTIAEVGGHFTFEVEAVTLKGENVNAVENYFYDPGSKTKIACKEVTYAGSVVSVMKTATELKLTPTFKECEDVGTAEEATYVLNGCTYVWTVRKVEPEKKDNTFDIQCPVGKKLEIVVKEGMFTCTVTIKPQTVKVGGISYVTGGANKTHDITGEVTMEGIHAEYHGGLFACGYTPNPKTVEDDKMVGRITLKGYNANDEQIGITATGN